MTELRVTRRAGDDVREMVRRAFGDDRFTDDDWEHALGGRHVVVVEGATPLAHAAVVPRTLHVGGTPFTAGYVEAVATAPEARGRGLGTRVMEAVGDLVRAGYDLGALSTGRPEFYERLGWERWRGPTYVLDGRERRRTPDEDAGVLVLRHGRSADLDLTRDIACPARAGDDW